MPKVNNKRSRTEKNSAQTRPAITDSIQSAQRSHQELQAENAELLRANQALQESNKQLLANQERLERVLEGSDQGFWDWDLVTQKFTVSERFESMLGFRLGERDLSPEEWSKIVHPDDLEKAKESISLNLSGQSQCHEVEIRALTKTGEWKHILTRGKIVRWGEDGSPLMMSGTHTDITERKTLLQKLELQASKDYLTGLNNRGHFIEQAEWELKKASRYGKNVAVLMIDIDNFKTINDAYGHEAGDDVLMKLSGVFRETLRQADIMGRFGGDEFVILQPETNQEAALATAERLMDSIRHLSLRFNKDAVFGFTVSIGISSSLVDNHDLKFLLSQADKALYRAKETGRNRVCVSC